MNYRSPRSEGPGAGRGHQQPPRSGGRTPPPANAGRVVGGRPGAGQDRQRDDRQRDRFGRPIPPERRDPDRADRAGRDRASRDRVNPDRVNPDRGGPERASRGGPVRADRAGVGRGAAERSNPRSRPGARTSDARWQPLPEPERPASRPSRPGLLPAKVFLAIISALVLIGTGYYSSRINGFTEGLTTVDINNDSPPVEKPADGAIDILMVGMDSRTDAHGQPLSKEQLAMLNAGVSDGELNTDTLIMVRIPNDGGPAVGVSFPRDSYVDIANGYGMHKINSAYVRAKNDAYAKLKSDGDSDEADRQVKSNQQGALNLIATIQDLTGVSIEHYAEVNLLGFYDISNAIGGIDVCLNAATKDKYSGANFPAGPQTLAGQQALAFVRQRHGLPNGDLDRIVRQQVFMSGMAKKVLSGDALSPGSGTFDKLQAAVQKSVVLDKDWNVLQFAQQMMGITGGKVKFQTIPHGTIDLKTKNDGSAIEVDPATVHDFVQGLIGKKDTGKGKPSSTSSDDASANSKITVNVRNATKRNGLAGDVSDALVAKGFTKGEVATATARTATVVRHATGEKDSGDKVASALGGNLQVEEDSNLPAGSVTVLLGTDYSGPGSSGSGGTDGNGLTGRPLLNMSGPAAAKAPPAPPPANPGCVN